MSRPLAFLDFPEELLEMTGVPGVVDRVHDGDTYLAWFWNRPHDTFDYIAIRVAGFSSPELWEPGGPEDAEKLRAILPRDTPLSLDYAGRSFNRLVMWTTLEGGRRLHQLMGAEETAGNVVAVELQMARVKAHDALTMPPVWPARYDRRGRRI